MRTGAFFLQRNQMSKAGTKKKTILTTVPKIKYTLFSFERRTMNILIANAIAEKITAQIIKPTIAFSDTAPTIASIPKPISPKIKFKIKENEKNLLLAFI